MRLKNKKHKHFSRTDNKKYQEQNHKKEKTNNNNNYCCYFYRIRVHYTVLTQHTTPHTTPNQTQPKHMGCNQQDIISLGVIYRTTLVLL